MYMQEVHLVAAVDSLVLGADVTRQTIKITLEPLIIERATRVET